MTTEDPVEGLYSFFLMGLAWLRKDNPNVLARRGASVFSSYERTSPVFKSARGLAMLSWDLMERLRDGSEIYEGDKYPPKRDLRRLIADSEKHNVILVVPRAELDPSKLFGPEGCAHVITDAGAAYAMSVADKYSGIVTEHSFIQGWQRHKAQMTNLNAKLDRTSGSTSQSTGEGTIASDGRGGYIPPAQYTEKDFDW